MNHLTTSLCSLCSLRKESQGLRLNKIRVIRVIRGCFFLQNKPNLLNAQMNVNNVLTKVYENVRLHGPRKQTQFKANQSQYKANFPAPRAENKPNQTQLVAA